ncbi:MAG: tRNA preQ1(34) S-adenosylmethionine ribosyltransferase-isomerase QueA [Lachnospiraceae bacterium]|nr:tRNA preQ1(34) S-adenosylmethionine ribosyltransferase-isomerase QueA [Lachnospiraceae bacterium]
MSQEPLKEGTGRNAPIGFSTSDYAYELPKELIAQDPLGDRSSSRLLVMDRETGVVSHHIFKEIPGFLRPGDCLVFNDTKVIPARLLGVKKDTGAAAEILLLKRTEKEGESEIPGDDADKNACIWECLVRPGKKLRPGAEVVFGAQQTASDSGENERPQGTPLLTARILEVCDDGNRLVQFFYNGIWEEVLDALGEMPLPPYITHKLPREMRDRYQTVYAKHEGSAAAPTAGLHFTQQLLDEIRAKGVETAFVTLHVGLGTFRPVKVADVREHVMHTEVCEIGEDTAEKINAARRAGGRIFCVGTTSVRTLESFADEEGIVHPGRKDTNIFIYPGYHFKAVDALITNFHLPESTLLMLVSAFAGRERVLAAYEEAVRERYRFFSFGDAMLLV